MGTNFYTLRGRHIGKRSAAGPFCWDCNRTLCRDGIEGVHQNSKWDYECPQCGKEYKRDAEGLSHSSAGRELGFNHGPYKRKSGIATCSSFTWAVSPSTLRAKTVKDEYGRTFSIEEFKQILEECPIRFYMIGRDFS